MGGKRAFHVFLMLFCCAAVLVTTGCTGLRHGLYRWALAFERGRAGLTERTVDLDGRPVALLEGTRGPSRPVLVLVHGFGADKDNWLRFARHWREDFYVVALDLPGHGDSFKDLGLRYDLDDQVQYLGAILTHLGMERCHLAGNSMGGAIAALYAATYPDRVQSVMLFAPGGIYRHPSETLQMIQGGENPLIPRTAAEFDRLMDLALAKKPFIPWPITGVLAQKAVADREIKQKVFADIHGPHRYRFEAALGTIRVPTLILWGRQDRVLNADNAPIFQQLIPGARLVLLDGIGHAPMIEAPAETARICRAFIESAI